MTKDAKKQDYGKSYGRRLSSLLVPVMMACILSGPLFDAQATEVNARSLRYLEQAEKYAKNGNAGAAIIEFKNAIRTDDNNLEARFELALLYNAQLDGVSAEKELVAARSRGFDRDLILIPLATSFLIQGKYEELLSDLPLSKASPVTRVPLAVYRAQAALAVDKIDQAKKELAAIEGESSDRPELWFLKSWIAQSEGDYDIAMDMADKALEIEPENTRALLQKAELYRQTREFEASIPFFTKVLEAEPLNPKARLGRGYANLALKNTDAVIDDADIILERISVEPNASYLKAVVLAQRGQTEEALELLAKAYRIDTLPSAMYLAAALQYQEGQLERARTSINKYLTTSPTSLRGLVISASIHLKAGETDDAIGILERVREAAPEDLRAIVLLADGYSQKKQYTKATDLYELAIQSRPENEDLRYRAAKSHLNEGQIDTAIQGLEDIVFGDFNSHRAAVLLFLTHVKQKDVVASKAAIKEVEQISGETPETKNFRATVALMESEYVVAETHLRDALSMDPNFVTAKINLARLLDRNGKLEDSRALYEEIRESTPEYTPAILGLIELARQADKKQEVLDLLDEAVASNPQSTEAHVMRVKELLSQGRKERALVATRDFMEAMPHKPEAFDALARAQIANGQMSSAVVTYRKLENILPDNPQVRVRLAQAMLAAEDQNAAKEILERTMKDFPEEDVVRQMRILLERDIAGVDRAENLAEELYGEVDDPLQRLLGLGNMMMSLGNEQRALDIFRDAYSSSSGRGGLVPLYLALDRTGEKEEAERILRDWMGKNPDDVAIQTILASWLIQNGRFQDAITETETLQRLTPEDSIVLNNLAWLYEYVGRHDEAILLARQAYTQSPNAGELADTYGWILYSNGKKQEGLEILTQAAQRLAKDYEVQYHYAAALAGNNQPRAALEVLNRILEIRSTFAGREEAEALQKQLLGK
jgi:putative PEP-CTERM system TPR-repeat lipoprotein